MLKRDNLIVGLVANPAGAEALRLIFFLMEWFFWALHLMSISATVGTHQSIQLTHWAWRWAPAKLIRICPQNTSRYCLDFLKSPHKCVGLMLHVNAQSNGMVTMCTILQISGEGLTMWEHECCPRQLISAIALIFQFFFEWLKLNGTTLPEWAFDPFKWLDFGVPNLWPRNYSS